MVTHWHITAWVIALILVFVTYALYAVKNERGAKIAHMVLRLFYILVILTGAEILFRFAAWTNVYTGEYIGKTVLGLVTVGLMEMLLIRKRKGKPIIGIWIGFIIVLLLTIALGLRLPLGFKTF